jgi:hypothetical protein
MCLGWLAFVANCGPTDHVLEGSDSPGMTQDASAPEFDAGSADANVPPVEMDAEMPPSEPDAQLPPPVGDASTSVPAAAADCDLNGLWAVQQQTVNVALALPQTANNWYFFELRHEGENVRVIDHFDCGIEVLGTVHVEITPQAVAAMIGHNLQVGRRGTMKKTADGSCALAFERFWSVRGANESRFAPDDRAAPDTIDALAKQKPLPTKDQPDGAEDWDTDGQPGIAWHVMGIVSGSRHSVQRDFTEWFTDGEFRISPARDWTSDLSVRSTIGSEEKVLASSSPTVGGSGSPDAKAKHRVTLRFLGRQRSDERARNMLKANPVDTCLAIRTAMPAAELK